MLKLLRAGEKWGAEIYKKKKDKKTRSFAGILFWLVLPTPLMRLSQVHMKKSDCKMLFSDKFGINFFQFSFFLVHSR